MKFTADKFFEKYVEKEGKSLAWLARQLGYSPTYVRKVSCRMIPVSAGFVGRAVTVFSEDPTLFLPEVVAEACSLAETQEEEVSQMGEAGSEQAP